LAAAGFGAWWKWGRKSDDTAANVDMVAVMRANNRGVGHMEQFKYPLAQQAFEEVVRLPPASQPRKINLGIALLNQGNDRKQNRANLRMAETLFRDVLAKDEQNPHAHHCLGLIYNYEGKYELAIPHFEKVTQLDPDEPADWFYLGKILFDDA